MASLALRHCSPLKKGTNPIRETLAQSLLAQLDPAWHIAKDKESIQREFSFSDFYQTIGFVNALAWMANHENHHPELEVGYNRCLVNYTSHAAKGLTVNDFICAAKTDSIYSGKAAAEHTTGKTRPAAETEQTTDEQTKTKPAETGKTPALNLEEASELLEKTVERTDRGKRPADDDEDEFELIDPAQQLKAEAEKAIEQTQPTPSTESQESPTPDAEDSAVKRDSSEAKTSDEDIDLMATVILPPGMESVPAKDDDEEATVILPADKDHTSKPADAGQSETPDQETHINPPAAEDSEDEKTMIIRPPNIDSHEEQAPSTGDRPQAQQPVKNTPKASQPSKPETPQAPHKSDNTDRPVPDKPTQQSKPQKTDTSGKENRPAPPGAARKPADEENVERTMALTSDPLGRTNRNKTTQADSSQNNKPSDETSKTADQSKKKDPDPEIEDDETLVMHSNTYKPVKKRR